MPCCAPWGLGRDNEGGGRQTLPLAHPSTNGEDVGVVAMCGEGTNEEQTTERGMRGSEGSSKLSSPPPTADTDDAYLSAATNQGEEMHICLDSWHQGLLAPPLFPLPSSPAPFSGSRCCHQAHKKG